MKKVTDLVGTKYKNGQVKSVLEGDTLFFYYENGILKAKGPLQNETMIGKWEFFHKNGKLSQIGNFNLDIKHGEFTRYDQQGNSTYHAFFENGKLVKK